jgi:phosphoribosyl 1,2-cyclic phosphodiesterase
MSPAASSSSASSGSTTSSGRGTELVLLGTAAGPVPAVGRTGIASALVVDGHIYIVDMGHGSFDQFQKSGLDIGDLDNIFITHLHSDTSPTCTRCSGCGSAASTR